MDGPKSRMKTSKEQWFRSQERKNFREEVITKAMCHRDVKEEIEIRKSPGSDDGEGKNLLVNQQILLKAQPSPSHVLDPGIEC